MFIELAEFLRCPTDDSEAYCVVVPDEMIGRVGRSESAIDPRGKVFVRGEYWNVVADTPIEAGESVEVLSVEGLVLRVRRAVSSDGAS